MNNKKIIERVHESILIWKKKMEKRIKISLLLSNLEGKKKGEEVEVCTFERVCSWRFAWILGSIGKIGKEPSKNRTITQRQANQAKPNNFHHHLFLCLVCESICKPKLSICLQTLRLQRPCNCRCALLCLSLSRTVVYIRLRPSLWFSL